MLANSAGEITFEVIAEGATAPEPLRHTDRVGKHYWRAGPGLRIRVLAEGVSVARQLGT
jgi:hypothetical protein